MESKSNWYKDSLQTQIEEIDKIISVIKKDTKLYIESIDDDYSMVETSVERTVGVLELIKYRISEIMNGVDKNEKW